MAVIGYARVSTTVQKLDSQIGELEQYGVDKIYTEKESGLKEERPVLNHVLTLLQPGDTFVIFKLDRLARSTQHLLQLVDGFAKNDIQFVSLQNNIDTTTPTGKLLFTIMGAFAEMEATLIRERVTAGLKAAREKGVKLGRPSPHKQIDQAIHLYLNTEANVMTILAKCDITAPTLYKHLSQRGYSLRSSHKHIINT
ncbi:recombinase family protein [Vagococcus sp. BWB3-3]|uniref:Recombinase family protein n=1 Tax=Vagococcus allomyrinae TaxID=2794353 RepID=A0A940STT9_9ENTE|nr:recombinase family protein [Vagococcus allomyrinae]MBP1040049.1 recombinase family protein [Vagococcus allomyrinae]